jgi:hypothetical protein
MPGPILHVGAVLSCPHAAPAQVITTNGRVMVNAMPAATMADTYPVAACPFQIPVGAGTKPQPCTKIQWTVPAVRVKVNGSPVILGLSTGLGQSVEGIPQGPPIPSGVQPRVVAT